MEKSFKDCIELLQKIISFWPRTHIRSNQAKKIYQQIFQYTSKNFRYIDILSPVDELSSIKRSYLDKDQIVIDFYDIKNRLHRAVFKLLDENWYLESLTFECLVCSGTGVSDNKNCIVCKGKGWGAIGIGEWDFI